MSSGTVTPTDDPVTATDAPPDESTPYESQPTPTPPGRPPARTPPPFAMDMMDEEGGREPREQGGVPFVMSMEEEAERRGSGDA